MSDSNDEIDLIELFKSLYSFTNKYKLVLIGGLLLGLALGYYTSSQKVKKSRDIYRTHILINSPFIDKDEVFMIASSFSYEEGNQHYPKSDEVLFKTVTKIGFAKKYTMGSENPDVSITFNTTEPSEIVGLITYIKDKYTKNELFLKKYKIEKQNHGELTGIVDNQLKELGGEGSIDQKLLFVSLIEKKQELAKKLILIKDPIICAPVAPVNEIEPAVEFSYFEVISSGLILALFFALFIKIIGFIKLTIAK